MNCKNLYLWVWGLLASSVLACGSLLGLEDRTLDTQELAEEGYEGCVPGDGDCAGCTLEWHRCICEGWEDAEAAAVLRLDCADLAPVSVREAARSDALDSYSKWKTDHESQSADDTKDTSEDAEASDTVRSSNAEDGGAGADDASVPEGKFGEGYCDFEQPGDVCQGCLCGDCLDSVEVCIDDEGCTLIMACVFDVGCDPDSAGGALACAEDTACGEVISDHGGQEGESFQLFRQTLMCATDSECPCGQGPAPAAGCNPQNGCDRCPDCWGSCFCSGGDAEQCLLECASATCTPDDDCSGCGDCMAGCLCSGTEPPQCQNQCPRSSTGPEAHTIQCGTASCSAFLPPPPDPIAPACCVVNPQGSQTVCGLDAETLFPGSDTPCLRRNQPGELTERCPGIAPEGAPYYGSALGGCCREDGECGVMDDVTGLGCVRTALFGLDQILSCD